ncbi:DUF2516 family protein [Pseudokineococcus sp. 1T1Z-3]|uniref:DUF2516 family protein n=1 Tax=Pseudokineococcus sp. 1T1Z-3 TaxID=3132745 RepID=UPI0030A49B4F
MNSVLGQAQGLVLLVLGLGVLALCAYALVDAVRQPQEAYVAAGKLTKTKWVAILAIATLVSFATLGGLGFLFLLSLVAAGVYLADVRPALRSVGGGRGRSAGPSGW